jgi:hypothetical protein
LIERHDHSSSLQQKFETRDNADTTRISRTTPTRLDAIAEWVAGIVLTNRARLVAAALLVANSVFAVRWQQDRDE